MYSDISNVRLKRGVPWLLDNKKCQVTCHKHLEEFRVHIFNGPGCFKTYRDMIYTSIYDVIFYKNKLVRNIVFLFFLFSKYEFV